MSNLMPEIVWEPPFVKTAICLIRWYWLKALLNSQDVLESANSSMAEVIYVEKDHQNHQVPDPSLNHAPLVPYPHVS